MSVNNNSFVIKASLQEEIRRIKVDFPLTSFSDLESKMRSVFLLGEKKKFFIKYQDDDNDWIVLSSDVELSEAIAFAKGGVLRLSIVEKKPKKPVAVEIAPTATTSSPSSVGVGEEIPTSVSPATKESFRQDKKLAKQQLKQACIQRKIEKRMHRMNKCCERKQAKWGACPSSEDLCTIPSDPLSPGDTKMERKHHKRCEKMKMFVERKKAKEAARLEKIGRKLEKKAAKALLGSGCAPSEGRAEESFASSNDIVPTPRAPPASIPSIPTNPSFVPTAELSGTDWEPFLRHLNERGLTIVAKSTQQ